MTIRKAVGTRKYWFYETDIPAGGELLVTVDYNLEPTELTRRRTALGGSSQGDITYHLETGDYTQDETTELTAITLNAVGAGRTDSKVRVTSVNGATYTCLCYTPFYGGLSYPKTVANIPIPALLEKVDVSALSTYTAPADGAILIFKYTGAAIAASDRAYEVTAGQIIDTTNVLYIAFISEAYTVGGQNGFTE